MEQGKSEAGPPGRPALCPAPPLTLRDSGKQVGPGGVLSQNKAVFISMVLKGLKAVFKLS